LLVVLPFGGGVGCGDCGGVWWWRFAKFFSINNVPARTGRRRLLRKEISPTHTHRTHTHAHARTLAHTNSKPHSLTSGLHCKIDQTFSQRRDSIVQKQHETQKKNNRSRFFFCFSLFSFCQRDVDRVSSLDDTLAKRCRGSGHMPGSSQIGLGSNFYIECIDTIPSSCEEKHTKKKRNDGSFRVLLLFFS
jgi:hypothetical protein